MPIKNTIKLPNIRTENASGSYSEINDDEAISLINYMPIMNRGLRKIPNYNTLIAAGGATTIRVFNAFIANTPLVFGLRSDGSFYKVNLNTLVKTEIGGAGTFTASALANTLGITQWKQERILIVDTVKGYCDYDGTTLSAFDASKKGYLIEVFEGRVWIVTAPQTVTFSAPNSYTDFSTPSGGGTFIVTDSSLKGDITGLKGTPKILYVAGLETMLAISNLTISTSGVTTFQLSNLQINAGCRYHDTMRCLGNKLYTLDQRGVWEISGYSFKRISAPVDIILTLLLPTQLLPVGCVTEIYSIPLYMLLTKHINPVDGQTETGILVYYEGRWFEIHYGQDLTYIEANNTTPTLPTTFGSVGSNLLKLFDPLGNNPIEAQVQTKSYDFGEPEYDKQVIKAGMVVQYEEPLQFDMDIVADHPYSGQFAFLSNELIVQNNSLQTLTIQNNSLQTLTVIAGQQEVLAKKRFYGRGKRISVRVRETSPHVYAINSMMLELSRRVWW